MANNLTPAQDEALAILEEEMGELAQAIGKIRRHGMDSHNPDDPAIGNNLNAFIREAGDVAAALQVVFTQKVSGFPLVRANLEQSKQRKLVRLRSGVYLHHLNFEEIFDGKS